jgi:hypothetical protein
MPEDTSCKYIEFQDRNKWVKYTRRKFGRELLPQHFNTPTLQHFNTLSSPAFISELTVKAYDLFSEKNAKHDIRHGHNVKNGFVDAFRCQTSALLVRHGDHFALRTALRIGFANHAKQKQYNHQKKDRRGSWFHRWQR